MIKFVCPSCGHKLTVKSKFAGRKAKCPNCQTEINIPEKQEENLSSKGIELDFDSNPAIQQGESGKITFKSDPAEPFDGYTLQQKKQEQDRIEKIKRTTRKHFWLFDIFLYPLNNPGLSIIAIFTGVFYLYFLLDGLFRLMSMMFPPMFVFLAFHWVFWAIVVGPVMYMYLLWYFTECISDSAEGYVRSPQLIAITPGPFELLGRFFLVLFSIAIPFLPFMYYFFSSSDPFSYKGVALLTFAVFTYPMMLLSVSVNGSLEGLNPLRVLFGILKTFFSYIGLHISLLIWHALVAVVYLIVSNFAFFMLFFAYPLMIYQVLVTAHLLGRFYFKNQEKLKWDDI